MSEPETNRNGESSLANDQRNTNAERQRRYRDKKRGGPPQGRWAGHVSARAIADVGEFGRTLLFYSRWLLRHAPDLVPEIATGRLLAKPTYERAKAQYDLACFQAVEHCHDHGIDVEAIEIIRTADGFGFQLTTPPEGNP